ncbi:hypothetical protein TKK_0005455 [Trichogramma kaykai]
MRLKSPSGSMSSINVSRLDLNKEIPKNRRNKIGKKEKRVKRKVSFFEADIKKFNRECEEDCSGSHIDDPINEEYCKDINIDDPINHLPDQIIEYWSKKRMFAEYAYAFARIWLRGNHKHHSFAPNRNWNGITITLNIFAVLTLLSQISSIYPGH